MTEVVLSFRSVVVMVSSLMPSLYSAFGLQHNQTKYRGAWHKTSLVAHKIMVREAEKFHHLLT